MALSNVSFTNNLGTITLTRVMYSLAHNYQWNSSGQGKNTVVIDVNGSLKAGEALLNSLHHRINAGENTPGEPGILTLPNAVYNNIKITNISYEGGTWSQWGRVNISFEDENEGEDNDFTFTLIYGSNSYTLYNPSVTITPSTIKRAEQAIHNVDGWFRQQLGHDIFKVSVSGSVRTDPCSLPDGLIEALEQKSSEYGLENYPKVADLKDFIPEAEDKLDIKKVLMTSGKIVWHYEDNNADVSMEFLAPPQEITI